MTATADRQEYTFQTEIKQLLHLLSHSLYQNREITIRELISNASDALDKMHFLQLTDESVRNENPLEIVLEPNRAEKTLTIRDNGVGMTREELVENLGTIAHSGSLAFLEKLSGDSEKDLSLIGQFGVGFYSSFMVADRVEVFTRSYQSDEGLRWESDGTGSFIIEPADVETPGTAIVLHLRDEFEEFTEPLRLRTIVRKYSSFVRHPIKLQPEAEEEGKPAADPEQLNEQRPIWVEPKSQLDDEQYNGFYQHLAHRGGDEKPLWHLHLSSDSPLQFHTILYCPPNNFELMGFGKTEHGLHLCAKRILVEDDNRQLLPEYLRFLYGIVDSDDLPLNVSRQALQDDTVFRKIRKVLVKKVLDHLAKLADDDAETFRTFIEQFGSILREGITTDFEHRERIAKLLRFHSSKVKDDELVSLDDYVDRIETKTDGEEATDEKAEESDKSGDEAKKNEELQPIYFATGTSVASLRRNPNLEIFEKRGIEVLFLIDPINELVFNHLGRYRDHNLVSIESADLELPDAEDESTSEEAESAPNFDQLLVLVRDALGDDVAEVRESKRLTDSPCCIVTGQGLGTHLQKVLSMQHDDFSMGKHTFEINSKHPFVRRLGELVPNPDNKAFIEDCSRQLLANALLQAGLAPKPEETINRTQQFMEELAGGRSSIMT